MTSLNAQAVIDEWNNGINLVDILEILVPQVWDFLVLFVGAVMGLFDARVWFPVTKKKTEGFLPSKFVLMYGNVFFVSE